MSVLILTRDEEINLPGCLESVAWSDDVMVFDSHSVDRTVEIARASGSRVAQRAFDNYAAQRNAALHGVTYRHPWLLMVDADERVTPELAVEIREFTARPPEGAALARMRRKDMFMGRWLRRSSGYPTWFGRLVRPTRVHVEREINEEYHTDGQVAHLREHLLHYPFNRGLDYWLERHNRYSSMEATKLIEEAGARMEWGNLCSSDPVRRRRGLKQLACRLPGRPALVFLYLYLGRLGLLDGRAGLTFCALRGFYEYLIDVKRREAVRRCRALPV